MRLLNRTITGLVLALPAPALGQVIKPADLVGTWVSVADAGQWGDSLQGQVVASYLTLDANGTYKTDKKKAGEGWYGWAIGYGDRGLKQNPDSHGVHGPWSLTGDTLLFAGAPYHAELKDQRLLLWSWYVWGDTNRRDDKCANYVFQRFDVSKPLKLPPPPSITIKLADLVGTWVGTRVDTTRPRGLPEGIVWTITDTLTLGADSTATKITRREPRGSPTEKPSSSTQKGTWALLPGDLLQVLANKQNVLWTNVVLQGTRLLVTCNSTSEPIYQRVAP